MTNAELLAKIKAEIERLTDELELQARENAEANNGEATDYCFGIVDMQMNLLSFLSTLESGSSEIPKDLEHASKEYCPDDAYPFGPDIINKEVRKAFIAGYNLCKEQTEKRWLEDRDGCFWDGVEEGKKAMKEKMLKEAVEGTIVDAGFDDHTALVSIPDKRYDEGDKVRIIVLPKEDEK